MPYSFHKASTLSPSLLKCHLNLYLVFIFIYYHIHSYLRCESNNNNILIYIYINNATSKSMLRMSIKKNVNKNRWRQNRYSSIDCCYTSFRINHINLVSHIYYVDSIKEIYKAYMSIKSLILSLSHSPYLYGYHPNPLVTYKNSYIYSIVYMDTYWNI